MQPAPIITLSVSSISCSLLLRKAKSVCKQTTVETRYYNTNRKGGRVFKPLGCTSAPAYCKSVGRESVTKLDADTTNVEDKWGSFASVARPNILYQMTCLGKGRQQEHELVNPLRLD
eukprot:scaffold11493_cov221-Amphora_coffeaeformis.AAC.2